MLKNKIYVLILLTFIIAGINYVRANNDSTPLLGKVIYLDPGHGGVSLAQKYE